MEIIGIKNIHVSEKYRNLVVKQHTKDFIHEQILKGDKGLKYMILEIVLNDYGSAYANIAYTFATSKLTSERFLHKSRTFFYEEVDYYHVEYGSPSEARKDEIVQEFMDVIEKGIKYIL